VLFSDASDENNMKHHKPKRGFKSLENLIVVVGKQAF
jgi:hypothetical protein